MKKIAVLIVLFATLLALWADRPSGQKIAAPLRKQIELRLDKIQSECRGKLDRKAQMRIDNLVDEIRTLLSGEQAPPPHARQAISAKDLQDLKEALRQAVFAEQQLTLLRTASRWNYYTSVQIMEILELFNFSDGKLEALKITFKRCTDPGNSFKIVGSLSFDKDKAQEIIDNTVIE